MPAQKKQHQINLLPQDKFAASAVGRILTWLLSTFRIIVILIELVVMGAFLSRFWLDAKNSDLNDELKQKKALIAASKEFEDEFRLTQEKIKILTSFASSDISSSSLVKKVADKMPSDVYLNSLTKSITDTKISGFSSSERSIAQFIANLEADKQLGKITLNQIDTGKEDETLIAFVITISPAETKKEEKK